MFLVFIYLFIFDLKINLNDKGFRQVGNYINILASYIHHVDMHAHTRTHARTRARTRVRARTRPHTHTRC